MLALASSAALGQCDDGLDAVGIDFSSVTNPAVTMEWTDANGQSYTGIANGGISGLIPFQATDTTGGAFPGGSVRWAKLGSDNGQAFDLIVSVSAEPSYYSDYVAVEYSNPQSTYTSQAVYTTAGFACLGFGVRTSFCESGASLDATTANCVDGTPTTLYATEYDFTFVEAGTTTQMAPFSLMYTTFYDVDGDVQDAGVVYEVVTILGASSRTIAPSSTLAGGVFYPSEALFAFSTQSVNVPTDFSANPATPSSVSLPAIVSFEITGLSSFKCAADVRTRAQRRSAVLTCCFVPRCLQGAAGRAVIRPGSERSWVLPGHGAARLRPHLPTTSLAASSLATASLAASSLTSTPRPPPEAPSPKP